MKRWGLILIGVLGVTGVFANELHDIIRKGNQKFNAGEYETAQQVYGQVIAERGMDGVRDEDFDLDVSKLDVPPELLHNMAATYFKLGDYERARDAWVVAAARGNEVFDGQCHYNLGNVNYAQARAAQQSGDLNAAKEFCLKANQHYRESLQLNRKLDDARVNMELTCKLLKELTEQQQEHEQQQDPNSQCDNPQDPNQPNDPNQQNQQQDPNQPQDPNQQQDQQQNQPQQQDPNNAGQQQQNQSSQDQQQDHEQDQQQNAQDAQQQQDEQNGENNEQQQEQQNQQSEAQQGEQDQPSSDDAQPTQSQAIRLSPQEAERLLQMVREREQERREQLRQRAAAIAAKQKKVDRDW